MRISYSFIAALLFVISGTVANATIWTVQVVDYQFMDDPIAVYVGDTIHWEWNEGTHTTTSTTVPAGAASWNADINSSQTFYEYVVTVAGTYEYHCLFHSSMIGSFEALVVPCSFVSEITSVAPLCPNSSDTLWALPAGAAYQWFKGGAELPGATNQYLVVTTADVGFQFSVEVTLDSCTDESDPVTIGSLIFDAPVVMSMGDSWMVGDTINVCDGGSVTLSLMSPYDTNIQWYDLSGAITGATLTELTVNTTGTYTVTAAPSACPDYLQSADVEFNVNAPIVIAITQTDDTTLSVSTTGLAYQWYLDGNPITGATDSVLHPEESGVYTVAAISDNGCTALSDPFIFIPAGCPFNAEVSPINLVLCPNATDTLFASPANGIYQWYKNGALIPGATNPFYMVDNNDAPYYFSVAVTIDGCTDTSAQVLVDAAAFLPPVVENTDPNWVDGNGNLHICAGDTVVLTLLPPYNTNIQWFNDGTPIPGATSTVLNVISTGYYTVHAAPSQCPDFMQNLAVTIPIIVHVPVIPVLVLSNDTIFANPMTPPYQWFLNGDVIAGETNYWIVPTTPGLYNAVMTATDQCSAISGPIAFGLVDTCAWEPTISPNSLTLCPNTTDVLTVTPVGAGYQWYRNGLPIGGAMFQNYTVHANTDGGDVFTVIVVMDGCIDTSAAVPITTLTFPPIEIIAAATGWEDANGNINVCDGETFTLSIDNPYDTNIEWFNNGNVITGADNQTLSVTQSGIYTVNAAPAQCPDYTQSPTEATSVIFHALPIVTITLENDTLFASPAADTGYHWYLNGNIIAGATNDWYVPSGEGSYMALLNDENQCSDESNTITITGINDLAATTFNIYPNPVKDELVISYSGSDVLQYRIYDVAGKVIAQGTCQRRILTDNLSTGAYLLSITDKQREMKQVFLKE